MVTRMAVKMATKMANRIAADVVFKVAIKMGTKMAALLSAWFLANMEHSGPLVPVRFCSMGLHAMNLAQHLNKMGKEFQTNE